ncbi:MAG: hypothetical protein JSW47_07315 [Phycisphaerales bacterium]|nr:MAG: hypothetical protein JSW47_07315 [Phycisphaerales bacterium]
MGSFSNYLENRILDHLFSKNTYTSPTIYVALSTADPGEDGSGLCEPSGNGYARVQTTENDWNDASGGATDNAADITFSQATGSWGTISHFALMDAASVGNLLASAALDQSKTIDLGDTAKFAAGDLDVTLD